MRWSVILIFILVGFLFGAYVLASPGLLSGDQEVSAADAPAAEADSSVLIGHLASLVFGVLAVVLLFKKSDSTAITLFSLAVLSTLFGRYVGPLILPAFI